MKRTKHKKACHFKIPYNRYSYSKTQTIPIEIVGLEDNSYHPIISVEINGIPGDMIIDTGASVTVVDDQLFMDKVETQTDIQMQSGSVTGQIHDVRLVKASQLKIGNHTFKNIRLAAIDLQYVNDMYDKHLSRKIIGLLGCDFCVKYHAVIDYRNKEFSISF